MQDKYTEDTGYYLLWLSQIVVVTANLFTPPGMLALFAV